VSGINSVIEKAMNDKSFCESLISNPAETLKAEGVEPTDEMLAALKDINADQLNEMASTFDKNQAAT